MKTPCDDCRFFARYYIKRESGSLGETNSGYCKINGQAKNAILKRNNKTYICENWEKKEIQVSQRRENIIDTLSNMAKQIHEIAMILQSDSK